MKEKIIIFAIGLLVGAVLSTGAYLVFTKTSKCNMDRNRMEMKMDNRQGMQNNNQPNMPGNNMMPNNNGNNNQGGQPPEMPNNNTQNNN